MKKVLLIVGLLLVFALTGAAQEETKGLTAKGFKVGLNMANVTGSDVDVFVDELTALAGVDIDNTSLTGFAFGAFFTFKMSPTVAIQPEVLYSMKGFTLSALGADVDMKIDYLEVPVLFKLSLGQSNTKPCLFAGPALGIVMSSKMEAMGLSVDMKDAWKGTDLGLVFGAGVDFPMGSGVMTLDGRYSMGLSNIPDAPIDINIKNSNLSFMVGYGF